MNLESIDVLSHSLFLSYSSLSRRDRDEGRDDVKNLSLLLHLSTARKLKKSHWLI
jgi:hypothetical protein